MARPKQFETRQYVGASVPVEMTLHIESLRRTTGIGTAEYIRRLIVSDMDKQHSSGSMRAVPDRLK